MIAQTAPAKRRRPILWLIILLLLVIGLGWWWLHGKGSAGDQAGHGHGHNAGKQSVSVATVGRGDIRVVMDGLGTVTPLATVTVRTQINGQLMQLGFTEGQIVHQGDFLAQIDPRPYQVALEQAQGALARDQALLHEAELDLARYRKLLAQDSIASQQVDTQSSLVKQYQGTVVTDQSAIDSAKLNLVYCHITAPVTGRVGLRQVDAGNYVQTSDTNGLVVLTQLQPISAIFSLPEDDIPQINAQINAQTNASAPGGGALQVTAFDRASTAQLATGTLLTTDNQIDTTTGTVKLRAQFANPDFGLFPNQFVNARLLVETHRNVITAPNTAIQRGAPGTYAYVVEATPQATDAGTPDGEPAAADKAPKGEIVSLRKVTLGPQDGDMVEIKTGLLPGDRVVTDGADKLRDGAPVQVPADHPQHANQTPSQQPPAQQTPAAPK